MELHPWNSNGMDGANTYACCRFYKVSSWLNTSALQECPGFSQCLKINQVML